MLKSYDEIVEILEKNAAKAELYFLSDKSGHTDEEIKNLEEKLGMQIHEDYKNVLKDYKYIVFLESAYVPINLDEIATNNDMYKDARSYFDVKFPEDCYTVGIYNEEPIYLQNSKTGFIYGYLVSDHAPALKKIANNFQEFMNLQLEELLASGIFG